MGLYTKDYPLLIYCSFLLKMVDLKMICLFKMMIFHSYVSLPEGTPKQSSLNGQTNEHENKPLDFELADF